MQYNPQWPNMMHPALALSVADRTHACLPLAQTHSGRADPRAVCGRVTHSLLQPGLSFFLSVKRRLRSVHSKSRHVQLHLTERSAFVKHLPPEIFPSLPRAEGVEF